MRFLLRILGLACLVGCSGSTTKETGAAEETAHAGSEADPGATVGEDAPPSPALQVEPKTEPAPDQPPDNPRQGTSPIPCDAGSAREGREASLDVVVPEMGLSLRDVVDKGLVYFLDVEELEPCSGPGWVPDKVVATQCGAAVVSIVVEEMTSATVVTSPAPSEGCPNAFYVDATVTATSSDGAVAEVMSGTLAVEFDAPALPRPSRVSLVAQQPLAAMHGTARPSIAQVAELEREWKESGKGAPFEQFFQVEVRGNLEGVSADLRFLVPQGGLRYATWRNACMPDVPGEPVPETP